jgi:hypothetical protein
MPLPSAVPDTASFPMFLGIVDEYHAARYASGFPAKKAARRDRLAAA